MVGEPEAVAREQGQSTGARITRPPQKQASNASIN
jgi:hypothetical protein